MTTTEPRPATTAEISSIWRERWGLPVITPSGRYSPNDVEGLVLVSRSNEPTGLITWRVTEGHAEVVTLDAWPTGQGLGSSLLHHAEQQLGVRGVRRLWLVTTNDNLRALRFYLIRGYRLVRLHLDAMGKVRAEKTAVPLVGTDGLPLRDMWELEKDLSAGGHGLHRPRVVGGDRGGRPQESS